MHPVPTPPSASPLPGRRHPADFSDDEFARRRGLVGALAQQHDLDAVVAYGANRFGSAVPWLTAWPVTREAAVVLRPASRPTLLVGFPNHVPNAQRLARDADVGGFGDRNTDMLAETLRAGGPTRRVGTIGPVTLAVRAALDALGEVVELDAEYARLRSVKSSEERAVLRHAATLTDASASALVASAVPGATELDLVAAVEASYAGTGAVNHIHYVAATAMAAPDRCVPAQWPSDRRLESGYVVLFELSTTWGSDYPGQLLRTVTVDADPLPLYRELHEVAEAALTAMASLLRPGVLPLELRSAADVVLDAGFTTVDDLLHGFGGGYLPPVLSHRGLPHGRHAEPLQAGMTVVVQPNVCTPDLRAGVQTGELFEITEDGARSLHSFPRGLLRGGAA
jgi:Xaa-Pro aminopeptidase